MDLYRDCCFPISATPWRIKLLQKVLRGGDHHNLPPLNPRLVSTMQFSSLDVYCRSHSLCVVWKASVGIGFPHS